MGSHTVEVDGLMGELQRGRVSSSEALESLFVRKMETDGTEKARIISKKAVEWGHDTAEGWAREKGFARYLTALEFNAPSGRGFPG